MSATMDWVEVIERMSGGTAWAGSAGCWRMGSGLQKRRSAAQHSQHSQHTTQQSPGLTSPPSTTPTRQAGTKVRSQALQAPI